MSWIDKTQGMEELKRQLLHWRRGGRVSETTNSTLRAGFSASGKECSTLEELCLLSLAESIASGRSHCLRTSTFYVPPEFIEFALHKAVSISGHAITDDVMEDLLTSHWGIEALPLQNSQISDRTIRLLFLPSATIRHLDVRGCKLSEQVLGQLFKKPKLKPEPKSPNKAELNKSELNKAELNQPQLRTEEAAGSAGRLLESLWLSGCGWVTDFTVTRAATCCTGLRDLRLRNCTRVTDDGLEALSALPLLQFLDIEGLAKVSEEAVAKLARLCTSLRELNLARCEKIGSASLWAIAPRVKVRKNEVAASWEEVEDLQQSLHVESGCGALRALSLSKCIQVTDSGVGVLSQCQQLMQLDVSGLPSISDSALMPLLLSRSLTALILRGSKMLTDATLQALARTSSALTLLDASHSPHFSDRGVHSLLSAARRLEVVSLSECPRISDKGLRALTSGEDCVEESEDGGKGLREVHLANNEISTAQIWRVVKARRRLELLVVPGTGLTKEAAADMRIERSNLEVVFEWELEPRSICLPAFE
mmetsp:Transcript_57028/g.133810  ORF Transcript_57028/g.133810 Transcript_57028/m.133810 type:complete len:537 (+) Transcript_57028:68-1678(+)